MLETTNISYIGETSFTGPPPAIRRRAFPTGRKEH